MEPGLVIVALAAAGTGVLLSSLRVLYEYQRGVVFRLGKLTRARGPGLIFLLPFGIERMRRVDLRIVAMDIAPQDTITRDNVSVRVNAVVYFRVADPTRAINEIEDYYFATSQLAQTTLRSVIGQSELDEVLAERDQVNETVRRIIDEGTDPWGIEVVGVEVKDIDLPQEMKRAMARQAEAERERRGKVIAAEGEFQASMKLAEAAAVMGKEPMALQLRFLQTVVEIAAENNSTTLFPIPIDLFRPLLEGTSGGGATPARTADPATLPGEEDPRQVQSSPPLGTLAALAAGALAAGSAARAPVEPADRKGSASRKEAHPEPPTTPETGGE
jgi:regulator of protease activity HflC (stomatin/prohibitin superfamily)